MGFWYWVKKYPFFDLEIAKVHGEMNHQPFISSKYWMVRNMWVEIGMNFEAKSSAWSVLSRQVQFWAYGEEAFKWLNVNIRIPVKEKRNQYQRNDSGVSECFQYEIWEK